MVRVEKAGPADRQYLVEGLRDVVEYAITRMKEGLREAADGGDWKTFALLYDRAAQAADRVTRGRTSGVGGEELEGALEGVRSEAEAVFSRREGGVGGVMGAEEVR